MTEHDKDDEQINAGPIFLGWGLRPAEGVKNWWGARGIYRDKCLDLLHNRMSFMGFPSEAADGTDVQKLDKWLSTKALPYLRSWLEHSGNAPMSGERLDIFVVGDGYVLRANPNRSYGYMYLVAHVDATATDPTPKPLKAKRRAVKRKRKPSFYGY